MSLALFRSPVLGAIPHGFFGRSGGVSAGAMWGLNAGYGSGDDPAAIAENRRRAIEAVLPGAQLTTVHQVHGAQCVEAGDWPEPERPRADALVTDRPGLLLGILTADCAPVLLAEPDAHVVGAAHAGWRGAVGGITESAIAAMERLGARRERICAAVGPCIGQDSYEVDEAFRARFLEQDAANDRFFTAGPAGRPHFDLPGYVRHRLLGAGISAVETLRLDTYCDPDLFYSYRRSTHRGEPSYGRHISMIGLAA